MNFLPPPITYFFHLGTKLKLLFIAAALAFLPLSYLPADEFCAEINPFFCCGGDSPNLLRDLALVQAYEESKLCRLPVIYSHYAHVGYFNMPSSRMGAVGTFVGEFSSVPPYRNYGLGFQLFERLELSGVYRIFTNFYDANLSQFGFGEYADKGINLKLNIVSPEDTDFELPGLAIGSEDILGSRLFRATYVVATKVWRCLDLEMSLGYGWGRIRGFFGGLAFAPWLDHSDPILKKLHFAAEYDATNYLSSIAEPHPDGRVKKSPINLGLKYVLDFGEISLSYIRGDAFAFALTGKIPIGVISGVVPKVDNPLPYHAPLNWQQLCSWRPERSLVEDLAYALNEQGFLLLKIYLEIGCKRERILRVQVANLTWRCENQIHNRIASLLAGLTPSNIDEVIVELNTEGLLCQEYRFRREDLYRLTCGTIGECELQTISSPREITCPSTPNYRQLYDLEDSAFDYELKPRFRSFFGSSKGKFKAGLDLVGVAKGLILDKLFYKLQLRVSAFSMKDVSDRDTLNPSQLLNVNTDRIRYFHVSQLFVEQAYLQRSWNLGRGWYCRGAVGLFDVPYGGAVAEALYYPAGSHWAFGIEGTMLRKRKYDGIGFTSTLRKWVGVTPEYIKYDFLYQYFLDFYYDFSCLGFKLSLGQFLARDFGARAEVIRYFDNGLKVYFWFTVTNGNDHVNCERYFDKGVGFSLPLDFFLRKTNKSRWNWSMAAWLRDVGYRAQTGTTLYPLLRDEREY